jgi:hypothetical protein
LSSYFYNKLYTGEERETLVVAEVVAVVAAEALENSFYEIINTRIELLFNRLQIIVDFF